MLIGFSVKVELLMNNVDATTRDMNRRNDRIDRVSSSVKYVHYAIVNVSYFQYALEPVYKDHR